LALSQIEANLERLTSDRRILTEQLEAYATSTRNGTSFTKERDYTLEAHRVFLANETEANSLVRTSEKG
jgi:hypothetical protein